MYRKITISIMAALAALLSVTSYAQSAKDLYKGFQDPPKEARPRVWWHWMNGNITPGGLRKDHQGRDQERPPVDEGSRDSRIP